MSAFVKITGLIQEQVSSEFKQQKEDIMQERLKAFKEQDMQSYTMCIQKAATAMAQLTQLRTQQAFEHLQYTPQMFQQMNQQWAKNPEFAR